MPKDYVTQREQWTSQIINVSSVQILQMCRLVWSLEPGFELETGEIKIRFSLRLFSSPKLCLNRASLNEDSKGFDVVNFGFQPLLPLNNCRSDVGKTSNTDFCHNLGISVSCCTTCTSTPQKCTCTKSNPHKEKKTETSSPTSHVLKRAQHHALRITATWPIIQVIRGDGFGWKFQPSTCDQIGETKRNHPLWILPSQRLSISRYDMKHVCQ